MGIYFIHVDYMRKKPMNKKPLIAAVSSILLSSVFATQALAADGTITFNGKVTKASCDVTTDSKDMSVTLPSISSTAIGTNVGDMAGQTAFTIKLENCESQTATAEKVRVAFVGASDDDNIYALKNTATADAATGVALQILQQDGETKIDINNGANKAVEYAIPAKGEGATTLDLHYNVAYVNTLGKEPTTGDVLSVATYSVEYN